MAPRGLLPIENFQGVVARATFLVLLLLVTRHPVEELAITLAVLYVALWLCSEGIFRIFLRILDALVAYGEQVSRNLGVGIEEMSDQPQGSTAFGTLTAMVVMALLFGAVLGSALSIGGFVVNAVGLTPLPELVLVLAGAAAVVGTAGLTVVLLLTTLVFYAANRLSEVGGARFSHFQGATREVDAKLRQSKLVPAAH